MKRMRLPDTKLPISFGYKAEMRVREFFATRRGDPERGPAVWMRASEARKRMLQDGELVWVHGPRRNELAVLGIDESIPEGDVRLRDIAGIAVSESVSVTKPDLDTDTGERRRA